MNFDFSQLNRATCPYCAAPMNINGLLEWENTLCSCRRHELSRLGLLEAHHGGDGRSYSRRLTPEELRRAALSPEAAEKALAAWEEADQAAAAHRQKAASIVAAYEHARDTRLAALESARLSKAEADYERACTLGDRALASRALVDLLAPEKNTAQVSRIVTQRGFRRFIRRWVESAWGRDPLPLVKTALHEGYKRQLQTGSLEFRPLASNK